MHRKKSENVKSHLNNCNSFKGSLHFYMTGTLLAGIEEFHLLAAIQKLRPDVTLPSRMVLSGKYLHMCYWKFKVKVDAWISRSTFNCLTRSSWLNVKIEAAINYMLVLADTSLFLESKCTGEQGYTAAFVASDMSRVIKATLGKVSGVTMENSTTNKSVWDLLKREHPDLYFQGCLSHGFHLFAKDIFAATKAKGGRDVSDYLDGYPFKDLLSFIDICKKVVKFFHNHHGLKLQLNEALATATLKMLAQIAPTRWGSIQAMAETFLAADSVLHQLVTSREFIAGNASQKEMRGGVFDTVTAALSITLKDFENSEAD
jgi:Protein of unknown function (DUF 659)